MRRFGIMRRNIIEGLKEPVDDIEELEESDE